ncbi:hypothetical protein SMICM17S_00814 [Streptomyces microflavus]
MQMTKPLMMKKSCTPRLPYVANDDSVGKRCAGDWPQDSATVPSSPA